MTDPALIGETSAIGVLDLALPDTIPIVIRRGYRQGDLGVGPFGVAQNFEYQLLLIGDTVTYTYLELITGTAQRIRYNRISPGTGFADAVLEHTTTPTRYHKSRVTWNPARPGWDLTFPDGSGYEFVSGDPGAHVSAMRH